jgi:hypothetical protein
MKKLLILVLFLVMTSFANAGLYTASSPEPFVITITAANEANSIDAWIDYAPLVAVGLDLNAATLTGTGASFTKLYVLTAGVDGYDLYYMGLASLTNWANGAELARLDLNGAAANVGATSVTLACIDGDTGLPTGQTIAVLIPEPATIALLCLGGLLLRRRK